MKTKAALHYLTHQVGKALLIYYGIILAVNLMFFILLRLTSTGSVQFNGFEVASMIFIFVTGINMFKETFLFFMQHGRSRRTLYVASVIIILLASLVMATVDLFVVRSLNIMDFSLHDAQLLGTFSLVDTTLGIAAFEFSNMTISYALLGLLGMFLGALYYRMNLMQKLVVSIGVPVLVIIVLPLVDVHYAGGVLLPAFYQSLMLALIGISSDTFVSQLPLFFLIRLGVVCVAAMIYYLSTLKTRVKTP